MATYLVIGGCGFIGSHLCETLIASGHRVRVLDDLSTGSRSNLAPGAALLVGDVTDPVAVRTAMTGADGCFHLAAIASVERGTQDWAGSHAVNLGGLVRVLDAARAGQDGLSGPIPVVYASSAAVYGDTPLLPLTEDAPLSPLSAYGADKLGCELHARIGGAVHGIPTLGLRFFNVFGPRQDPRSPYSGVISIFCARLARGEAIEIHGDGTQTRDFVHVSDVVAALIAGMRAASTHAPVLNVCTGRAISILDLAAAIADVCGVALRARHRPGRLGEIRHSIGSAARLRGELGVRPSPRMRAGLAEVVAWLRAGQPGLRVDAPAREALRA